MGLRPHQHGAGHGGRLQPGAVLTASPERRVLHAAPAADRARHDRTGVDPDADVEAGDAPGALDLPAVGRDLLDDPQARTNGAFRVVLVRGGRPEERQHAVAREVLHVCRRTPRPPP